LFQFSGKLVIMFTDSTGQGDSLYATQAGRHGPNPLEQTMAEHTDRQ
jgi:hypothetical protein